ncbi:hypothetical protein [Aliiroseovarius crassostreae]|uniref:hypothetical protein n=1 Tax=Aliiroseovarius crassostreae TaxID=154981 RepID=UPI0021FB7972|nr:hypothetical protein [Aliiroseovarius crassostreae]UWQ07075.1 hypothetical protein K3X25_09735 [Aliiroseovarius crassostreae]
MQKEPHYTLDEIGIMPAGIKLVVFDQQGDFGFDSFVIFSPDETSSKGWEVWHTEWHSSSEHTDRRHPDTGDVKYKLIEIHSDWVTSVEHVHLVCQCLAMGYEVGEHDGRAAMQSSMKFAFAALTGEADSTELEEAAFQNGFSPQIENGSAFAKKNSSC